MILNIKFANEIYKTSEEYTERVYSVNEFTQQSKFAQCKQVYTIKKKQYPERSGNAGVPPR